MSDSRYRLITRGDADRLSVIARGLIGRGVIHARYGHQDWGEGSPNWSGPEIAEPDARPMLGARRDHRGGVYHQIDDLLLLDLDDGSTLEIGGVAPGFSWGIDVHLGTPRPLIEGRLVTDASATHAWSTLMGLRIRGVMVAWKQNDQSEPDTAWAVRLDLEGGHVVVVTLGDDYLGQLIPHPDSLVVIFDAGLAMAHTELFGETAWEPGLALEAGQ